MKPAPRTRKAIARTATQDRRANSLSSPPKTNVPPATISAMRETDSATGPVSEVATRFKGVSQGRPPPPPPAHAARASTKNSRIARACFRSNLYVMFPMTSFVKIDSLDILDRILAILVPGHNKHLPDLAARRQIRFLVDVYDQIDGLRNQRLLGSAIGFSHQAFEPNQAAHGVVGMYCCRPARMPRIPCLEHGMGLPAAYFADNNPGRLQAHARSQAIEHAHGSRRAEIDRGYGRPEHGADKSFEAATIQRQFGFENRPLVVDNGSLHRGDSSQGCLGLTGGHLPRHLKGPVHPLGP